MDDQNAPAVERVPVRKSRTELSLAVVVGAGGMGMAAARRLGERHRLILADRNPEHLAAKTAALIEEGHEVTPVTCDVTDPADVAALAAQAAAAGPLGALAHVVGLSPSMGDGRAVMSVNLIGARQVCEAFRPLAGPGGAALFVGSIAGHSGDPTPEVTALLDEPLAPGFLDKLQQAIGDYPSTTAYVLSKFALMRMVRRQASAWGARGARIVSISPGLISTPMGDLEFKRMPSKFESVERTPLRRQGGMLEVADAIDFLLSDRASFISGSDLLVDGGLRAVGLHLDTRVIPKEQR